VKLILLYNRVLNNTRLMYDRFVFWAVLVQKFGMEPELMLDE
jgi:hypothetical protein